MDYSKLIFTLVMAIGGVVWTMASLYLLWQWLLGV